MVSILKSIEKGVLDCSVPLLIPFLSLQVKLAMSKNIMSGLDTENKKEMIRDSMLEGLLNDITDIAILQEVIDRSQEKLNALTDFKTLSKIDASTLTDDTLLIENVKENKQDKFIDINKGKRDSGIVTDLSADKDDASTINDESELNTSRDIIDLSEHIETEILEAIEQTEKEAKIESSKKSSKDTSTKSSKEESRGTTPSPADTPTNKPESSEDSGVDVEENAKESIKEDSKDNDLAKSKSEKDIKNKILNIINEAKAQDESKKKTRNFGRNFEFQIPNLKPVIPNDRRPAKVKRMDDLWSKQVAARTGNWGMLEAPAPKPAQKVPWSKKKAAETVKRDSIMKNEEVDEFEKCRSALSEHKAGKKITMVEKPVKTEKDEKLSETKNTKEKEDNTAKIINKEDTKKSDSANKEESNSEDKTVEKEDLVTESVKIESQKVNIDSISTTSEKVEITEVVEDVQLDENKSDTEKESINTITANESKADEPKNNNISKKDEAKTDENEKALRIVSDKKPPPVPTSAALSTTVPTPAALSPVVPRRRDISAPSLPPPTSSPRVPPTPPPSRKPPPPPISPPPSNIRESTQSMLETTTVR